MSEFTGKAIMSEDELSIGYNTTAYASTKGDHNEVTHTPGCTIIHFAYCCCIGIIGEGRRQSEFGCYKPGNRYNSLPVKVRCIFDGTGIKITIRGADADAFNLAILGVSINDGHQGIVE